MAEIQCPLCGRKNWLPDGAERKCFFCGSPLSPKTDLTQDVQYAPPPEPEPFKQPEADDSSFVKQVLVVPVTDSSAETDAPAETDAKAQFSEAEQNPCAPVHYRMSEMLELPPEDVRAPEKKARAKLECRQWFLLNTAFICTQSFLTWLTVYRSSMDSSYESPFILPLVLSLFVFPTISAFLCPEELMEGNGEYDVLGFLWTVLFFGCIFGIVVGAGLAGGLVKEFPWFGFIGGSGLAIVGGAALSTLVNVMLWNIVSNDRK